MELDVSISNIILGLTLARFDEATGLSAISVNAAVALGSNAIKALSAKAICRLRCKLTNLENILSPVLKHDHLGVTQRVTRPFDSGGNSKI
jgi:hypothetical protein